MEKIKYIKTRDAAYLPSIDFKQIIKGVVLATISVIAVLLIAAIVYTYTGVSLSSIKMVSSTVLFIGAFVSGVFGSCRLKIRGWLHGLLASGLYTGVIFCINFLSGFESEGVHIPLLKILFLLLAGGVGGIVGVNIKLSSKRR